jgi:hypothetical protein
VMITAAAVSYLAVAPPEVTDVTTGGSSPGSTLFTGVAVHDAARRRVLVYGDDSSAELAGLFALALEPTPVWTKLQTAGAAPSPRGYPLVVLDASADRMLFCCGVSYTAETLHDGFALALGGATPTWSPLPALAPFPNAYRVSATLWDPVGDRMLARLASGEVWSLPADGVAWVSLPVAPSLPNLRPPTAGAGSDLYDPVGHALLMVAPTEADPWHLHLFRLPLDGPGNVRFTEIAAANPPQSGNSDGKYPMAYDPVHDRLFLRSDRWFSGQQSDVSMLPLAGCR